MPKKMVRFSGPKLTFRLPVFSSRSMSWGGKSWTKLTSPERRAATRVAAAVITEVTVAVMPGGTARIECDSGRAPHPNDGCALLRAASLEWLADGLTRENRCTRPHPEEPP